jgi:hypothetical protein
MGDTGRNGAAMKHDAPFDDVPFYKGWDAADAVGEWQDIAALRKAAHGRAKPYEPGPELVSWGNFAMDAKKGLTTEVTKGKGDNAGLKPFGLHRPSR